jgi:hypothetical protein
MKRLRATLAISPFAMSPVALSPAATKEPSEGLRSSAGSRQDTKAL